MRKALVTRADNNIKDYTEITHPIMKIYADKCNADFIIFNHEPPMLTDDGNKHYRILKARELFETYDRLLFLDSEMLINKGCRNVFDEVPEKMIGSIYEDVGSRMHHRRNLIKTIQDRWGYVEWTKGYTNAGCFVISKIHKKIFDSFKGEYYTGWGSVDVHFGYQIHLNRYPIFQLSFKWNHMTMFSEGWNGKANRFKSHIIHYAGNGVFDQKTKIQQIKHDSDIIYGK